MSTLPLKLTRRGMLLAMGLGSCGPRFLHSNSYSLAAQQLPTSEGTPSTPPAATGPLDWYCPMDRDVRSDKPGKCPRCGMTLVFGVQEEIEYPFDVWVTPPKFRAGEKVQIHFRVTDPKTHEIVKKYEIVHERLFHMFLVSNDLSYFVHDHPVFQPDGTFIYEETFPKPGLYRVAGDFYPTGGTPQLTPRTIMVPGAPGEEVSIVQPKLKPETGVSHCENMDVELTTDPPSPIVGLKTLMFLKLSTAEGLEQYIGAWGHMLAASDDLIDMIHDHPFIADGGPQMQFNIIFPRARTYRVWIQMQRKGVINTASWTIPVSELK